MWLQDHHYPELTTFETVDTLARLTLDLTPAARVEKVTQLMHALGLHKACAAGAAVWE